MSFINKFGHNLTDLKDHGPRYYVCKDCNIVLFISELHSEELRISGINKISGKSNILNLNCNEFIIKKLLE
jgi:hypothetical protein